MRLHPLAPDVKCPACGGDLRLVRVRLLADLYECASPCKRQVLHYWTKETQTCGYSVLYFKCLASDGVRYARGGKRKCVLRKQRGNDARILATSRTSKELQTGSLLSIVTDGTKVPNLWRALQRHPHPNPPCRLLLWAVLPSMPSGFRCEGGMMPGPPMRFHLLAPDVKCSACGGDLVFVRVRGYGDLYQCASGGPCHAYQRKESKICGTLPLPAGSFGD
jgi:hypothetical protein